MKDLEIGGVSATEDSKCAHCLLHKATKRVACGIVYQFSCSEDECVAEAERVVRGGCHIDPDSDNYDGFQVRTRERYLPDEDIAAP